MLLPAVPRQSALRQAAEEGRRGRAKWQYPKWVRRQKRNAKIELVVVFFVWTGRTDTGWFRPSGFATVFDARVTVPMCHLQTQPHLLPLHRRAEGVLESLLNLGISDFRHEVRRTVFKSLLPVAEESLAEDARLRYLIFALNDEQFDVQRTVLQIIGTYALHGVFRSCSA